MTELKKFELTEEALDQVSGGKIHFGKNTFKKIAIAGVVHLIILIGGGTFLYYKNWKKKHPSDYWEELEQNGSIGSESKTF